MAAIVNSNSNSNSSSIHHDSNSRSSNSQRKAQDYGNRNSNSSSKMTAASNYGDVVMPKVAIDMAAETAMATVTVAAVVRQAWQITIATEKW